MLAALVLVVLDAASVNVALPAIARSLVATPAEAVRVVTAYQMALLMALLPSAALGERLGHRRVYTAGVALFVSASALSALAPTLPLLLVGRFFQGLGGAAIMSLGVALLRLVVPPRRLGEAIGWNALAVALASAAGPTLGALVLSVAEWRWLFAVHLPLGALVLVATRALPRVPGTGQPFDLVSAASNAVAFGALVVGAQLLPERPALAALLVAAGALAMLVLVRRELPREAPMIPLDLLRDVSFRASVLASVSGFVGQSAAMVSLPFYLQHGLGQDALHTGLLLTPWPLSVAVVAPIAGRLAGRVPGARLAAVGAGMLALGLALATLWPLERGIVALVPMVVLCGVGFGLFQVSNNRNMLLAAPPARSGAAGGAQGTARLTGQTIGAVAVALLFAQTSAEQAPRIGLGIAAASSLVAGLASLLRETSRRAIGAREVTRTVSRTSAPCRHGVRS